MALPPARWATLYAEEAYSTAQRKMGRQAAGEGLLDALIRSEPTSRFTVAAPRGLALDGLRERLRALRPDLGLHLWPLDKLDRLQAVDALYVADPLLARWAWKRQWAPAGSRAYSLVGVTHTLCTQGVGEGLRELLSAPVQPWDAVICTSRSAQAAVQVVLEQEHTCSMAATCPSAIWPGRRRMCSCRWPTASRRPSASHRWRPWPPVCP